MSHGFYRGMSAPIATYGLTWGLYYGAYFHTARWLRDEERVKRGAFCSSDLGSALLAGLVSSLADLVVTVPVETVKTAMQAQVNRRQQFPVYHKSAWQCAKYIYQTGGYARLYRGSVALACREVPVDGLSFYCYESLVHPNSILRRSPRPPASSDSSPLPRAVASEAGGGNDVHRDRYQQLLEYSSPQRWGLGLGIYASACVAGAVAGLVAWTGVVPFDVVKNRLQADPERLLYSSMWDCVRKIYRREGWRVFWRGSMLVMLSAMPYTAVNFAAYEAIVRLLSGQKFDNERYREGGLGFKD